MGSSSCIWSQTFTPHYLPPCLLLTMGAGKGGECAGLEAQGAPVGRPSRPTVCPGCAEASLNNVADAVGTTHVPLPSSPPAPVLPCLRAFCAWKSPLCPPETPRPSPLSGGRVRRLACVALVASALPGGWAPVVDSDELPDNMVRPAAPGPLGFPGTSPLK